MSFFQNIAQGFEFVARETAKHVTAENIGRGFEEFGKNCNNAFQEVGKHVNGENIHRGFEELGKGCHHAAHEAGKAIEHARPHVERAAYLTKKAMDETVQHTAYVTKKAMDETIQHTTYVTKKAIDETIQHTAYVTKAIDETAEHSAKRIANALKASSEVISSLPSFTIDKGSCGFSGGEFSTHAAACASTFSKIVGAVSRNPALVVAASNSLPITSVPPILLAAPVAVVAAVVSGTVVSTVGGLVVNGVFSLIQNDSVRVLMAMGVAHLTQRR